jgi:hypothetical protein
LKWRESGETAAVVKRSGEEVTVEVTVQVSGSLLAMGGAILEASNVAGAAPPSRPSSISTPTTARSGSVRLLISVGN